MSSPAPWLETAGVLLLAATGSLAGNSIARRRKSLSIAGFGVVLAFLLVVTLARHAPRLLFLPPFRWVMSGRTEFALFALAIPFGFGALAGRLPNLRQRIVVSVGVGVCVIYFSVIPFLVPAVMQEYFAVLETRVDRNGVCLQSTGYTCGPAAAVTALRRIGFAAEEGELAILSHTSPVAGTAPDCLAEAMEERWGREGLKCAFRLYSSLDELAAEQASIALIRLTFLVDHYVAVLDVTDRAVVLGDPLEGLRTLRHEEFLRIWRYTGIALSRGSRPLLSDPAGAR